MFFELPFANRHSDPLMWWKQEEGNFFRLSKVPTKFLLVQGISVPSERVFSSAGTIVSEKRRRLTDKNASTLIFLHENLPR